MSFSGCLYGVTEFRCVPLECGRIYILHAVMELSIDGFQNGKRSLDVLIKSLNPVLSMISCPEGPEVAVGNANLL